MANKIALMTIIYSGSEKYFDDFFNSIRNQTRKDFDLIIINDKVSKDIKSIYDDLNIIIVDCSVSISKNRECGINYIIEQGYDYMLLCDIDDYFTQDRVEKSIIDLLMYDAVVNDLNIVTPDNKIMANNYFQLSHNIPNIQTLDFIKEKNICGFSNTGLNVKKMRKVDFPKDIKILDWYLFTLLIKGGWKIKFIPESLTYYRQHSNNLIGIDDFSFDLFKKMIRLKVLHYKMLSDKIIGYAELQAKYEKMLLVEDEMVKISIRRNQKINPKPLWWENIKL